MKKKLFFPFFIIASALLTACNPIRYITIETFNPADVTFLPEIKKIIIVNNAVTQPPEAGHLKTLNKVVSMDTINADSAIWKFCLALGTVVQNAHYFNNVLIWHDSLRTDRDYLQDRALTREQVNRICRESGADAVISVDRLLFNSIRNVQEITGKFYTGQISIYMHGLLRSYLPGRLLPVAEVSVSDSLFWNNASDNLEQLNRVLPSGKETIEELAVYAGARNLTRFIPHWQEATRWYYHSGESRWKEARVLASHNKWEEAAVCWERIYSNEKSLAKKAKAAHNIALANEITGDFVKALEWENRSLELLKAQGIGKNKDKIKQTRNYIDILSERLEENQKLNMQIGVK